MNNITIATLILLTSIAAGSYILIHQSPEDCYVSEMREWAGSNGITDRISGTIQKNSRMAVSKARTIMGEYELNDLEDEEARDIYIQVKTIFDYCGIES